MAAALAIALEPLVGNQAFERRGNRLNRRVGRGAHAGLAKARNERRGVEFQAGQDLTAVARAGAPANAFALETTTDAPARASCRAAASPV